MKGHKPNTTCPVCGEPAYSAPGREATRKNPACCSRKCAASIRDHSHLFDPSVIAKKIAKLKTKTGDKNPHWRGGAYTSKAGYVYIWSPDHPKTKGKTNKYIAEHVLVAERMIGRFLDRGEIVHHINHNRSDNSEDNLMVMRQGEHVNSYHRAIRQHRMSECHPLRKHCARGMCKQCYDRWYKKQRRNAQSG